MLQPCRVQSNLRLCLLCFQVRTFVSGVNPSAVSGVQVLDDTKLATFATLATAGEHLEHMMGAGGGCCRGCVDGGVE